MIVIAVMLYGRAQFVDSLKDILGSFLHFHTEHFSIKLIFVLQSSFNGFWVGCVTLAICATITSIVAPDIDIGIRRCFRNDSLGTSNY